MLNVVLLTMPPRDRREDIPALALQFIQRFGGESLAGTCEACFHRARILLENDPWPRDVGELENVIERAVVLELTS
jgi:DNA-binding NtrC family response regulator